MYLLLENLPLLEDLFHGHRGDNDPSLTLDDALHNVLNMGSLARRDGFGLGAGWLGAIRGAGEKEGIFFEGIELIVWPYRKNSGQGELQFLDRHGLKVEGEVHGRDRDASNLLPWVDDGFLDDADIFNASTRHHEVFVGFGNAVSHFDGAVVWDISNECVVMVSRC